MYIIGFFGSNNFAFEKLNLYFYKYFIIFIFTGSNFIIINKINFNCIKLFCFKRNILIFQFKNKFIYNNLLYYNNYIYNFNKKFSKIFIIISDYGFILSLNFINFSNYIINLHNSLLLSFRGGNPVLGVLVFFNKFFGSNIIYIEKNIDAGKRLNFYKTFKRYNYNNKIIKYNSSLINSFVIKKFLYYYINFFIYNFSYYKIINFFIKTK